MQDLKKNRSPETPLSEEELQRVEIICNGIALGTCVAVSVYGVAVLYPIFKDIYGHFYPGKAHDEMAIVLKDVYSV